MSAETGPGTAELRGCSHPRWVDALPLDDAPITAEACVRCGTERQRPTHDTAAPGACAAPGCPVLHDDPTNPVHPPWALEDVYDRLRRADRELRDMALGTIGDRARDRLAHKAEGVRLALSYVEEAIRASR